MFSDAPASSTAALYRKPDTDVQQPRVGPNQDHEQQLWPKCPCKAESTGIYSPNFCLSYLLLLPPHQTTPSTRLANQTPLQPKCSSNLPLSSLLPPLRCPSPSRSIPLTRVIQCSRTSCQRSRDQWTPKPGTPC